MPYRDLGDVLAFINRRERPLALYLFTNDKKLQDHVLKNTLSGGCASMIACCMRGSTTCRSAVSATAAWATITHGRAFEELSKMRPVFKQFSHTAIAACSIRRTAKVFATIYKLAIKLKI